MKKLTEHFKNILFIATCAAAILLMAAIITVEIVVWTKYGDAPVGEIPAWAAWIMWRTVRR